MNIASVSSVKTNETNSTNDNISSSLAYYSQMLQSAGGSISDYCTYDSNGNVVSIDKAAINSYLKEKRMSEEEKEVQNVDSFAAKSIVESSQERETQRAEADSKQSEIDNEYQNALVQYAGIINSTDDSSVADEWKALEAQAEKLTSTTASSTSILEGAKEFISLLTRTVKSTVESSNAPVVSEDEKKEDDASVVAATEETSNEAENLLDNPFFKSALNTSKNTEKFSLEA